MKYIGKDKYQVINYKNKITAKQKQKQKKNPAVKQVQHLTAIPCYNSSGV